MNNLKAKLKKQGGFTLIEMLIVVAIIAILVAISIPLANQALERSREATDAANERSFKAVLLISYLNGKYELAGGGTANFEFSTSLTGPGRHVYAYDATNGTLVPSTDNTFKVYGKSTAVKGVDEKVRKGLILVGCVNGEGQVHMQWVERGKATNVFDQNLICPELISDL